MDARGNGQYLAETAMQRYGQRIRQVMLSPDWYRDNMPRYKAAFEDGTIEIPKDAAILSDHRALVMDKGIVKVPERRERDAAGRQRHGDSAIAGALASFASQQDVIEYDYLSVPRLTDRAGAAPMARRADLIAPEDAPSRRSRFGIGAW
jgi:phage FluMu gp28-like protein